MCFLSSRFHIWWRGCGLLWSTICSHVVHLGFDFLLFSGVIWSPPLCFLKIIGTSELILDQNLYPVPRFEFLFSFVFWALPGFVSIFGKDHTFVLDSNFNFDYKILNSFLKKYKNKKFLIFGFTSFVFQYLMNKKTLYYVF